MKEPEWLRSMYIPRVIITGSCEQDCACTHAHTQLHTPTPMPPHAHTHTPHMHTAHKHIPTLVYTWTHPLPTHTHTHARTHMVVLKLTRNQPQRILYLSLNKTPTWSQSSIRRTWLQTYQRSWAPLSETQDRDGDTEEREAVCAEPFEDIVEWLSLYYELEFRNGLLNSFV